MPAWMPPVGFEPTIPVLDRAATVIGEDNIELKKEKAIEMMS
jgi:hypothetical protein